MIFTATPQWVLLLAFVGQIQGQALRFTIREEQEVGIKIGSLSTNYSAPYQLLNEKYIWVNESTGDLFTTERIDREILCPSETPGNCDISFYALVSPESEVVKIVVTVEDINDNVPYFQQSEIYLSIPEDAPIGSAFPLDDQAQDEDAGNNGMILYHLESSGGFFGITRDGDQLQLMVEKDLDRETLENHSLILVAIDEGLVPLSATANLTVTVTDVNDNCPEFDSDSPGTATVPVLGIKGSPVAQLKAKDKDAGQNGQITFSFSPQISDRAKTLFHMESHTGLISLAVDVRLDSPEEHMLKVVANSPLCSPVQAHLAVYIEPVAHLEPAIKIKFVADHKNQVVMLPESKNSTVLALLELKDTPAGKSFLSLEEDSTIFSLKAQAGGYLLKTSKPLDYETCSEYDITIVIVDAQSTHLLGREVIKVVVEDVNDNAPKFEQARYETTIMENNDPGFFLCKVTATDADSGEFGKVRYSLLNTGPFRINEESGVITVFKSLDREQEEKHRLTVHAWDGGVPPQEDFATLCVTVLDMNDNPPTFPTPHFSFFVSESILQLSKVGNVPVSDADKGDNGRVVNVHILNDNVPFAIDIFQGCLRSTAEVDREIQGRYELLVVAIDGGSPSLSTTVRITVFVEDVNDNRPRVILPSSNLSCLTITPSTRAGSLVTKIYAIDEDSGMNSDITYQIVASLPAHHSPFQIDKWSGNISLGQSLRGEDYGMHHLFIVVCDGGKPDPLQTGVWVNLLVNESLGKCHVKDVPKYLLATLPPSALSSNRDCRCESNGWLLFLCALGLILLSVCVLLAAVGVFIKHRGTRRKVDKKSAWVNRHELKPLNQKNQIYSISSKNKKTQINELLT
ncbi:protocadherin-20 [Triplophysa rosa]|uniref:protocadherin-20 n=1 Tax=Triplophysa rosa TaxID=992332 RepID=UPI002545E430|nr:protocadherin-20 [Triplophysa rosa]